MHGVRHVQGRKENSMGLLAILGVVLIVLIVVILI